MNHEVVAQASDGTSLEARRNALLVPTILATLIGGFLIATSLVLNLTLIVVLQAHPGLWQQPGTIYIPPSGAERVRNFIRFAAPIIAGVVLIVLTWRYRSHGRRAATFVCAGAALLMGILCWW
ncbi:MAG TPA: hypothetical protein VHW64_12575 [Nocardioides sp.]|uniref:hypothetical protein n=1 Tax=Nocardioides sp. TaxID=35761 RepID=UPI002E359C19|nr:hypothetical protein [Nocardioides sp.]HEX3931533.1 hypothetical protein [Nocardioides sp.]